MRTRTKLWEPLKVGVLSIAVALGAISFVPMEYRSEAVIFAFSAVALPATVILAAHGVLWLHNRTRKRTSTPAPVDSSAHPSRAVQAAAPDWWVFLADGSPYCGPFSTMEDARTTMRFLETIVPVDFYVDRSTGDSDGA